MKLDDLTGKVFGRLTVVSRIKSHVSGHAKWLCKCECGTLHETFAQCLKRGHAKSCGCWDREAARVRATTHGMRASRTYRVWLGMKQRCTNPNNPAFERYGGRGIKISWSTFEEFYKDMGESLPGTEIDRINNDDGYHKGNCRWLERSTHRHRHKGNQSAKIVVDKAEVWAQEFASFG